MKIRMTCERAIQRAIIREALKRGCLLSVYDGGEETVSYSSDYTAVFKALRTTDDDYLILADAERHRMGWIRFIYGNDGWDVVNDYAANPATEAIMDAVEPVVKRWEERLS